MILRDGEIMNQRVKYSEAYTLMHYELMAQKLPPAKWEAILDEPFYDAKYIRVGIGQWVLIEEGKGFA